MKRESVSAELARKCGGTWKWRQRLWLPDDITKRDWVYAKRDKYDRNRIRVYPNMIPPPVYLDQLPSRAYD